MGIHVIGVAAYKNALSELNTCWDPICQKLDAHVPIYIYFLVQESGMILQFKHHLNNIIILPGGIHNCHLK